MAAPLDIAKDIQKVPNADEAIRIVDNYDGEKKLHPISREILVGMLQDEKFIGNAAKYTDPKEFEKDFGKAPVPKENEGSSLPQNVKNLVSQADTTPLERTTEGHGLPKIMTGNNGHAL